MFKTYFIQIGILAFSISSLAAVTKAPNTNKIPIEKIINDQKIISEMAHDPHWLRLVHYHEDYFSSDESHFTSQEDDPQFFVSASGKISPELELRDTIWSLQQKTNRRILIPQSGQSVELSVRCQFPARAEWIRQQLKFKYRIDFSIDDISSCAEFSRFRDRVGAKSVTLIFSSYYMNNPSSTFGHTLMRLNRTSHEERDEDSSELLDVGVNYAANPTTDNQIYYAYGGLAGTFPGTFTVIPYYYKVREYNDFESRDLWEYNLALTTDEVQMLVAHIWELSFATFDYLYISENCSYHMLSLLEAASPRLQLTSQLPYWVVPGETVRLISEQSGIVHSIRFRPSIHTQFNYRLKDLSPREYAAFKRWQDGRLDWGNSFSKEEKARILDVALDFYDYKYATELMIENTGRRNDEKKELLIARSELPRLKPLVVPVPEKEAPHKGHSSGRGGLLLSDLQNWEFNWRFSLHDFLDPVIGYPQYAEINFFALSWLRRNSLSDSLLFQKFHILGITSLAPVNEFEKNLSWRLQVGWEREPELSLLGTPAFIRAGMGGTGTWDTQFGSDLSVYGLLQTKLSHTFRGANQANFMMSMGPVLGVRWAWSSASSLKAEWVAEELVSPRHLMRHSVEISQTYQPSIDQPMLLEARVIDESDGEGLRFYFGVYRYF